MSCSGVQTAGGRVQVRWEADSAATPMGQLAYFIASYAHGVVVGLAGSVSAVPQEPERAEQGRRVGHLDTVDPVLAIGATRMSLRFGVTGSIQLCWE